MRRAPSAPNDRSASAIARGNAVKIDLLQGKIADASRTIEPLLALALADRKLSVTLTDAAREFIVKHGYDPVYGARPLKRAIQRYIQDSLALKILEGEFKEGDTVSIDCDRTGNTLRFETAGKIKSAKAV